MPKVTSSQNFWHSSFQIENTFFALCSYKSTSLSVTLDLRYKDTEIIRFVTDSCNCGRGFNALFEQIPCQHDDHTFRPDDEIPTSSTSIPTSTMNPLCDRDIQEEYFVIEIVRSFETCSINITKSSPVSIK